MVEVGGAAPILEKAIKDLSTISKASILRPAAPGAGLPAEGQLTSYLLTELDGRPVLR